MSPPIQYANPELTSKQIALIEDVMNATIREAVFVTEHLDAGSIEDAQNALIQIQMNASNTMRRLEGIIKRGLKKIKRELKQGGAR